MGTRSGTWIFLSFFALAAAHTWLSPYFSRSRSPSSVTQRVVSPAIRAEAVSPVSDAMRRDLIENLDRLVAYEHYYRSTFGRYTRLLSKLGYQPPRALTERFDVRIAEATRDKFRVVALADGDDGAGADEISVDQDYRVKSNFEIPEPRPEYLRFQALKHLRLLRSRPRGVMAEEAGIYREYFRFEARDDASGGRVAFAVGVRPPVVGVQLEDAGPAGPPAGSDVAHDWLSLMEETRPAPGPAGEGSVAGPAQIGQQAYFAQQVFHGETGRYARDWNELSRIASFPFVEAAAEVGLGDADAYATSPESRRPASSEHGLEIEPVDIDLRPVSKAAPRPGQVPSTDPKLTSAPARR